MPESITDRPTRSHEYVFLLTKREKYYYDAEAVREAATSNRPDMRLKGVRTGLAYLQQGHLPNNSIHKAQRPVIRSADLDTAGVDTTSRNKRSVWTVATQPFPGAHFATFPPKLIEPCILAGSRPGDTVLDPFGGAGTTGLAADRLGRD
ncbi:MAG TPA: site-specific DNA-methyltransferase, partial [Nitrospiraceae bacterium]|nr:site-specific DNA-methyltransferase [Nitrospiraceae bacterium]